MAVVDSDEAAAAEVVPSDGRLASKCYFLLMNYVE